MHPAIEARLCDPRLEKWGFPSYATDGSAALDLYAAVDDPFTLHPGEAVLIPSGLAIHLKSPNLVALMKPRSGLGSKGLVLGNLTGVIDSDYVGEIKISLWNRSQTDFTIHPGDRVAQLMIVPVVRPRWDVVDVFSAETERGDKGFGSSGVSA